MSLLSERTNSLFSSQGFSSARHHKTCATNLSSYFQDTGLLLEPSDPLAGRRQDLKPEHNPGSYHQKALPTPCRQAIVSTGRLTTWVLVLRATQPPPSALQAIWRRHSCQKMWRVTEPWWGTTEGPSRTQSKRACTVPAEKPSPVFWHILRPCDRVERVSRWDPSYSFPTTCVY